MNLAGGNNQRVARSARFILPAIDQKWKLCISDWLQRTLCEIVVEEDCWIVRAFECGNSGAPPEPTLMSPEIVNLAPEIAVWIRGTQAARIAGRVPASGEVGKEVRLQRLAFQGLCPLRGDLKEGEARLNVYDQILLLTFRDVSR